MAWTQQDLDELMRAYATGTRQVRFADGRQVTYNSPQEMLTAIRTVESAMVGETAAPPGRSYASFSRG